MNIRNLPDLDHIMGFDGEYAVFKAKDDVGTYQGIINRKGEIVWGDKSVIPILQVRDHPTIYMGIKRGESKLCYYDVTQQKYVDRPLLKELQPSKAELLTKNSPWIEYVDSDGHKTSYRSLQYLTEELVTYSEEPNKWGIKDLNGNILVPAQFEYITHGGPNRFVANKDGKCGVIDINGNWVIPNKYDHLFFRGNFYVARQDGEVGIINMKGDIIIPFEYQSLNPAYKEGLSLISAKKDGEIFFINSKQERIELF